MKLEETAVERARFAVARPDVMHSNKALLGIIAELVTEVERQHENRVMLAATNNDLRRALSRQQGAA